MTTPARPKVAMLLYPGLTPLDLIAPQTAFAAMMETYLVWKTTDPVWSDSGVALHPTTTFADCPADLDVLFVPGGRGQAPVAADEDVLEFLADRGARARYVTSVCGGSLTWARPDCCAATERPPTAAASKHSPCSARSTPRAGLSSTATGSPAAASPRAWTSASSCSPNCWGTRLPR
jgi:putative intracellular protease/amidase